ncbi:MAG: cytochrome c [Bacteroidota bacterium]|nr:cytochrome c [Bacteroidota bacterium]
MRNINNLLNIIKDNRNKFFGLTFIYVLFIGLITGLYYMISLNDLTRKNILPGLPDSSGRMQDLKIMESRIIPPIDVMKMKTADPQLVSEGKDLFTKVCASCHGEEGKGNGPGAAGLNPTPRNFTSRDGWKNGFKLSQIYKTLMEGFAGSAMIAYDYLTPTERFALAHYIRETFLPGLPADTDDELKTLDQTYSLSQGKETAAQIPVNRAIKIVISEEEAGRQKSNAIYDSLIKEKKSAGVLIFNRVVKNRDAALKWLSQNKFSDIDIFRNLVTRNVNINGFNRQVNYLIADEWELLYNFSINLFPGN